MKRTRHTSRYPGITGERGPRGRLYVPIIILELIPVATTTCTSWFLHLAYVSFLLRALWVYFSVACSKRHVVQLAILSVLHLFISLYIIWVFFCERPVRDSKPKHLTPTRAPMEIASYDRTSRSRGVKRRDQVTSMCSLPHPCTVF